MEKEKLINEIDLGLESLRRHVNRIKKDDNSIHKMDMDLLIEKTKLIYDKLIHLDALTIPFEMEIMSQAEPELDEEVVEDNSEEIIEEEPSVEIEEEIVEEIIAADEADEELLEVEKEILKEPVAEEQAFSEPKTEEEDIKETFVSENDFEAKSTIDLFSTSAEPTVSDKFSNEQQPTIADKITKEGVNELREAIGINEKFLFINELFNGDLNRYNKIVDELDELTTIEGVNTYMLELKIHNQWSDDNVALMKLTELLNRKFI